MNLKSRQRFIEIDGNTREFWERIDCRRSRKQNNPWVTISTIANILVLSIEVNQIITNYCYIRVSSRIKKVSTEELRFELPSFHSFNEDFFLFRSLSMKRLCAIEEENVNTTSERRRINRGGKNVRIEGKRSELKRSLDREKVTASRRSGTPQVKVLC